MKITAPYCAVCSRSSIKTPLSGKSRFMAEENPPEVFVKNCTGGGPRPIPSHNLGPHMPPDGG